MGLFFDCEQLWLEVVNESQDGLLLVGKIDLRKVYVQEIMMLGIEQKILIMLGIEESQWIVCGE